MEEVGCLSIRHQSMENMEVFWGCFWGLYMKCLGLIFGANLLQVCDKLS